MPSYSATFVGRVEELSILDGMLDSADRGSGGIVIISGESGIGKSSLVAEAARRARARKHRVLAGFFPAIENVTLDGLVQVFEQLTEVELGELTPATVQDLGPLVPARNRSAMRVPPIEDRAAIVRAAALTLQVIASKEPLFIIIEDVHWADPSALHLLDALARRVSNSPVVFAVTARIPGFGDNEHNRSLLVELGRTPGAHRIELSGLSRQLLSEMLARSVSKSVPEDVVSEIAEHTQGNPLFALELARSRVRGDMRVPAHLRELLTVGLDALPEATRELVVICALAGGRTHHDLLERVSELPADALDAALVPALNAQLLLSVPERSSYVVRHPLLAEAISETVPQRSSEVIHAALARAIDAEPHLAGASPAAAVAHHWMRSGNQTRAFHASVAAAGEAAMTNAHTAAFAHLERAISLASRLPSDETAGGTGIGGLYGQAAFTAELLGRNKQAVHLAREALALPAASDPELGERHLLLVELLRRGYHPRHEADRALERASQLIPVAAKRSYARVQLAGCWHWDTEPEMALDHGLRTISLAEELKDPILLCQALVQTGGAKLVLGDTEGGLRVALQGRSVAEEAGFRVGVLTSHVPIPAMLTLAGRPASGADDALVGLDRTRDTGDDAHLREAIAGYAVWGLFLSGRWDEAHDVAVENRGDGRFSTLISLSHARIATFRGDTDDAGKSLKEIAEISGVAHPGYAVAAAWHALLDGDPRHCYQVATRALEDAGLDRADEVNELVFLAISGASLAGHQTSADRARERLLVDPGGIAAATPWALSARAAAESTAESSKLWREALDAWDAVEGWPHIRVYVACRLADCLSDGAGVELLHGALEMARYLGADVLEGLVRATALRTSNPLPGASGTSEHLTPREREVLEMLADGQSNRAIGQSLGISEKTSSVHVSNLLRKLGVGSRTEAAVIAVRGR